MPLFLTCQALLVENLVEKFVGNYVETTIWCDRFVAPTHLCLVRQICRTYKPIYQ